MPADIIDLEEWKSNKEIKDIEQIQEDLDTLLSAFQPSIVPKIWGVPLYDDASSDWNTFAHYYSPFSGSVSEHPGSSGDAAELLTRAMLMLDQAGHKELADDVSSILNRLFTGEE